MVTVANNRHGLGEHLKKLRFSRCGTLAGIALAKRLKYNRKASTYWTSNTYFTKIAA